MKIFKYLIFLIYLSYSCKNKEKGFSILVEASMVRDSVKVYLINSLSTKKVDSTIVINGKCLFTGNELVPDLYSVAVNQDNIVFILENSKIKIRISQNKDSPILVNGSKLQDEHLNWFKNDYKLLSINSQIDRLYEIQETYYDASIVGKKIDSLAVIRTEIFKSKITENPNSFVSLVSLSVQSDIFGFEYSKEAYSKLSTELKNHPRGIFLKNKLYKKTLKLGESAPNFKIRDNYGNNLSSDIFTGKPTLLVFWASWCQPCRKEHPIINALHEDYKNKINIVGISIDTEVDRWKTAIKQDSLKWIQLSDLEGTSSKNAINYEIHAIPQNYLLNKDGKIIYKNIKIEDIKNIIDNEQY